MSHSDRCARCGEPRRNHADPLLLCPAFSFLPPGAAPSEPAPAPLPYLRVAAQDVVDAWHACREANSMQGFWTILDDLAAELDGRAALRRAGCICELGPSSAVPSQSCPRHGHGPVPGRRG